jgi:predicted secreted protein
MSLQDSSSTRRLVLLASAGLGLAPFARLATATPAAMDEAIRALVGTARVQRGKVKLELPPIVENGNTVPLTVTVDSPMSEADHVTGIHIFNEKNPSPTSRRSIWVRAPARRRYRPAFGWPTRSRSWRSPASVTAASGPTAPMSS